MRILILYKLKSVLSKSNSSSQSKNLSLSITIKTLYSPISFQYSYPSTLKNFEPINKWTSLLYDPLGGNTTNEWSNRLNNDI